MTIRSKILFLNLYRRLKGKVKKSSLTPFAESKNYVAIINEPCNDKDKISIDLFIKTLREEGKSVEVVTVYLKKKPETREEKGNSFKHLFFDKNDFFATGLPKTQQIKGFLMTAYDYLIFCNPKSDTKNTCIAGFSKSKCIIGPYAEHKTPGYDLIINNAGNTQSYFDGILNTLKQIR